MARRPSHQHEDHLNHEAWAIPYADLLTLLLAFFVVMYAISSLNEGKYRVVADSLSAAFGGPPRSIKPVQVGQVQLRGGDFDHPSVIDTGARRGPAQPSRVEVPMPVSRREQQNQPQAAANAQASQAQLQALGDEIEKALSGLVASGLVRVRRGANFLAVEIQSDLLFASGVATPSAAALGTIRQLAGVLRKAPNAVRVEGYTDNQPIRTAQFRSNWDLSAERATNVVYELIDSGIAPERLASMGYGEYQPIADNGTVAGRSANRRVELVILASSRGVDSVMEGLDMRGAAQPAGAAAAIGSKQ
ncbi:MULTISPECIES: flagellar motor protein MotD [Thermomonas]|jgi:chemotaxis protein MotB|uniref:flagellar motor protein MotD n=1 Tax=Thermomonas sp. TaxID=1971895 RepID=UPI000421214E|nr:MULTISPECIES: flagellar motor protein MotD [Thermomonas]